MNSLCPAQVFGQRGLLSKVLLSSSDLSKVSALDDEVTVLLRDFQVRTCLRSAAVPKPVWVHMNGVAF